MNVDAPIRAGVHAGVPLVIPLFALAISFGVLARPVMGAVAPIVMSLVVFAGAAQFATLSVLAAGGSAGAAIVAGLLLNMRFLPMGFAAARSFRGGALARATQGQAIVDASWALASRGDGTFDRGILIGTTIPQAFAWIAGTAVGVIGGAKIGNPQRFGLDAIFPAFYFVLLVGELGSRRRAAVATIGGAIAASLIPIAPDGIPVVAAALAALIGLRLR